ncbi:hypothetical protein ACMFMG_002496 [Clarireedia jacksonii]
MSSSPGASWISKINELSQGNNAMIGVPEFRFHQNGNLKWSADVIVNYYDKNGVLTTISSSGLGDKKAAAKLECCELLHNQLSRLLRPRIGECKIMKWQAGKAKAAEEAKLAKETTASETTLVDTEAQSPISEEHALDSSSSTSLDSPSSPSTPEREYFPIPPTPRQQQLCRQGQRHTLRLFQTATWANPSGSSSGSSSTTEAINGLNNQLLKLNLNEPSSPQGHVYISFDLEATTGPWRGHSTGTPTQLGITVFHGTPANLRALTSGNPTKALAASNNSSIQFLHFQFQELAKYRSNIRKFANSGPFLFGKTQVLPMADMHAHCQELVARVSQYGKITLVGHAVHNDIKYLQRAGVYAFNQFFEGALDTQQIFLDEYARPKGLGSLVEDYGGRMEGWHNAGNDAVWTMWVLMKRVAEGKGEELIRMEEEEKRREEEKMRIEEERKRFAEEREKMLKETEAEWLAGGEKEENPWLSNWGSWNTVDDWGSTPAVNVEW